MDSSLNKLNIYLRDHSPIYKLPALAIDIPENSQHLDWFRAIINKIFRLAFGKKILSPSAFDLAQIAVNLTLAGGLILILWQLIRVARMVYHKSENEQAESTDNHPVDLPTPPDEVGLNIWLRYRWRMFLRQKKAPLSLTPMEYSSLDPRLSKDDVASCDQCMFGQSTGNTTRMTWDHLFKSLES